MKCELLVIGAGTGGLRTASTAANSGIKTILVGDGPVAGTCLNVGCIPTKAMLHAADVYRTATNGDEVGISCKPKVDFKKVMDRVRDIIHTGRTHAEKGAKNKDGLTYIEGRAKFVGKKTIEVHNTRITAEKIIIATGTRATVPPIPGLQDVKYITNVEAVELKKQPKTLTIIGGGYIACEYATFFATLGTKVTILERAPSILTVLDEDIRITVRESLENMGVRIYTGVATTNVTQSKAGFTCQLSGADVSFVRSEQLLVACGRLPNTEDLHCERAGIALDERGFVSVNRYLQTKDKDIYAIGDVNGRSLFAHAAKRQGWYVLEHLLLNERHELRPEKVPWAVFTHPTVAGIGFSEQQLQAMRQPYDVMQASFTSCGKAKVIRDAVGKVKIMHHEEKILGACIVGPDADNIIHELAVAMEAGAHGLSLVLKTVHAHPTLSEVLENLHPRTE